MSEQKQKDVFLEHEADAYFERNNPESAEHPPAESDPVLKALAKIELKNLSTSAKLLEIGCGHGLRLKWISNNLKIECYGIDPSEKSVSFAQKQNIKVTRNTADSLPYPDSFFDILVFGFCLYLCDRDDLFLISSEANRVLKPKSWLIIQDFFSEATERKAYKHNSEIQTYKMDYRKLFDWHPAYTCFSHDIYHHVHSDYTDRKEEWVATSILRKNTY